MRRPIIAAGCFFLLHFCQAQTGPGGVGNSANNVLWLSADYGVYSNTAGTTPASDGNTVGVWNDRSGNGKNATHGTTAERPGYETNIVNGQPVIRFNAGNGDRLLSTGVSTDNVASVWAVASWSSLPSPNPGIIQGAQAGNAFSSNATDKVIGMWVSDGGARQVWGRGIQSNGTSRDIPQVTGTSTNTFYSFLNLYDGSNITQYVNNSTAGSISYNGTLDSWSDFGIGRQGTESWNGDIAEVIAYNIAVNSAQRIIINNYLAAKYNLTLSANDVYTQDNTGQGNFDYEVAGIGRVNASNIHDDAQGSGIVRILNPTDLDNNEFFMWGHDNGALQATVTTGLPSGVTARFARQWRVSETGGDGDVGNIDLQFDLSGLPDFSSMSNCDVALSLRLLVDTDNDGNYNDQTPLSGATNIGGNIYRFASVNSIGNNMRFTLAVYNSANDGPGGVGGTNGASSLVLWLNANKVSGTNGSTITTWNDQSGYGNDFTVGNGAVFNTSGVNGYPTFSFNGTSHYFERPFSSSLTPSTFTIFSANNVSSSGNYKAVISNRDDPPGNETRGFILYSVPTSNNWDFWTGNTTIAWQMTGGTTSTAGNWAAITASYQTGANGKVLYINNTQNDSDNHALNSNTSQPIRVGAGYNESTPDYYFRGEMGELIVYNTVLNSAERIIVNNYLAAKYGFTLTSNDIYVQDNAGQGNFDHDVAGIGRVDASNIHSDSKGTGMVRIFNPSDLENNEFFMWGHDNGSLSVVNTTDVPTGIQGRMSRVWRVSETGGDSNVGNIDIQFDLTGQGPVTASDLRLLIDADGDGSFSDGGTLSISGATALACNNYLFTAVPGNNITNGDRFTIGTVNISQTPLPIELASFSGEMVKGDAHLEWTTFSESNNDHFTVERSTNGKDFTALGDVPGSGTTKVAITYRYEDTFAPYERLYYRLRQTDFDEKYSYSDVIMLDNKVQDSGLVAIPNPAVPGEAVTLRIRHPEKIDNKSVLVTVNDLLGRRVDVYTEADDQGALFVRFNSATVSGIYIISVHSSQLPGPLFTRVQVK